MIRTLWNHRSFFIGGCFGLISGLIISRFVYVILFVTVIGMFVPAYADMTDSFGIQLSQSCMTMIKNNITSACPTYEEILAIFPDTSNQLASGSFGYSDNGVYERQPSMMKKHYEFYRYDDTKRMWVDPPSDVLFRMRIITIEPSLTQYKTTQTTIDKQVLEIGHGRWNDLQCKGITMGAPDWIFLLGDTIQYFDHDCEPGYTNFDSTKDLYFKGQDYDLTTSYKYKLDRFIKDAKERCKGLCFEY